jgi:Protein of unknown function (DUF3108)
VNPPWRRRSLWLAVLIAVLAGHAGMSVWLNEALAGWGDAQKAHLARMDVAFVKELAPAQLPVRVTAATAASPTTQQRPRALREPAVVPPEPPASAVEPEVTAPEPTIAEAASSPQAASAPVAEAVSPVASAASDALLASAPASAPASPSTAVESFDWPPSTRLTYTLLGNYRGEVHGSARVQWVRRGDRYQVHLDVFIGPGFAPLMSRRMTSEGVLSGQGLAPQRYEEITKLPFQSPRQIGMQFGNGTVTMANGQTREALAGLQDTASQFVHLAWLFTTRPGELRVGNEVPVPLALPRRMGRWVYDVVGEEVLNTPVGALNTFHLKPRRSESRPKGELSAEIWFAPTLQYLPVRIRMQQDADTYADLMLDAAPLQAEPEAPSR